MRFIHVRDYNLIDDWSIEKPYGYMILSHRWYNDEIVYADMTSIA